MTGWKYVIIAYAVGLGALAAFALKLWIDLRSAGRKERLADRP